MKPTNPLRSFAAISLIFCFLVAPITVAAKKGDKNYKHGLEFENAQKWELAAQEFALAVAADPGNVEYQLHYRRAAFSASQEMMQKGRTLAEQGDYAGAYNAFRQAYGYDPVNELALNEMQRALRLQNEKEGKPTPGDPGSSSNGTRGQRNEKGGDTNHSAGNPRLSPTSYQPNSPQNIEPDNGTHPDNMRTDPLRVINYSGDLESLIRNLAEQLSINVVFDSGFQKRTVNVNLRDVTAAQALDYIFISNGLFFQRLSHRTILIAEQQKRAQYQQLVLRTFYLQNIPPEDAQKLLQQMIPPQLGRQAAYFPNKPTNSLTVRDTAENMKLIGEVLATVDKDRAEVVMDVNIYEVSRTDLLELGNQIGTQSQLTQLGGAQQTSVLLGGAPRILQQAATATAAATGTLPVAAGAAFLLPTSQLSAFQSKDHTRLIAHTLVHAFDNEASTANIGEKVPVQTASVPNYSLTPTTTGNAGGATTGVFGNYGYPVIQYQDVGLTLKFTPQVFPNLDVQVKMEIKSNDVIGGASDLTPTFSTREITGMARIANNRTMMIASVAQDKNETGRQGLPVLGLIPILGRAFTTPTRNVSQSDIVITVTPRVLRAPTVTPRDEESHASGSMQYPTPESLEAMLIQADRDDQLGGSHQLARSVPEQSQPAVTPAVPTGNTALIQPAAQSSPSGDAPAAQPRDAAMITPAVNVVTHPAQSSSATNVAPQNSAAVNAQEAPDFVPAPKFMMNPDTPPSTVKGPAPIVTITTSTPELDSAPVGSPYKLLPTLAMAVQGTPAPEAAIAEAKQPVKTSAPATFTLSPGSSEMFLGQKQRLSLVLRTDSGISLAAATIRFDPKVIKVKAVNKSSFVGDARSGGPSFLAAVDPGGVVTISLIGTGTLPPQGLLLAYIDIQAIATGQSAVTFDKDGVRLMSAGGLNLPVQTVAGNLIVKH